MDFRVPELGEGVYEAELMSWEVKPGTTVRHGQVLFTVLTDKAAMEIPAPFAGTITGLQAEPGQKIKVGQAVLTYDSADAKKEAPAAVATVNGAQQERQPVERSAIAASNGPSRAAVNMAVRAAPSVRLMARKLGIDLGRVHGSGPGGRILVEDLTSFVKPHEGPARRRAPEEHPEYGKAGTRVKLQGLRRLIAERMVQSKRSIPHYSYVDECDVSELVRLREALRGPYERAGAKLTYLAFFVKAAVAALKEIPIVNATFDEQAGEVQLHDHYHIGVAVATSNGLMVPVLRDADHKDLGQVAREIERLSAEARSGKAKLDDLRGGTFTITSVGGIGGLISTPIINHPEVGILGLGKIIKRPIYDAAGNIRPADLIYLSLSFDHRIVDGAVGAAFGNALARHLRNPAAFLVPEKIV
ncbi:MAG TPA: dihydrolipoamide acetyltransferase family protein [Gemmataceae bacterium]|nr:dihydrolipoamide acetyltransferase family protein [Gemmataceae bacterium]